MRSVKFRAKSLFKPEWWTGYYVYSEYTGKHFIVQNALEDDKGFVSFAHFAEIDPKTLGEFTGLTDKNGKEIYEGDVVRIHRDSRLFYIRWFDDMGFEFADVRSNYINTFYECYNTRFNGFPVDEHIEIIGNIYENTELL